MQNLYNELVVSILIVISIGSGGNAESVNSVDYDFGDYYGNYIDFQRHYLQGRDDGYSAPNAGYGAPSDSYGTPSDSYGAPSYGYSSEEPDYGLLLTAGVATIGALATAFYIKDIQQKIDDQEDTLTSLKSRYTTLTTDYEDELVADEESICKTASDFVSVSAQPGDVDMNDIVVKALDNIGDPSCST